MIYDNIFSDEPESLIEKRLQERPGDESETLKEAGFSGVWNGFIQKAITDGWGDAVRSAAVMDKEASGDTYVQGKNEALDFIEAMNKRADVRGWYKFMKHAHKVAKAGKDVIEFCKVAQELDFDADPLEVGGFYLGAEELLEADDDIIKVAQMGPKFLEKEAEGIKPPKPPSIKGSKPNIGGSLGKKIDKKKLKAPSLGKMSRTKLKGRLGQVVSK